ncbi:MAG: PSD1 and planctomycete cytochrome C domain-containing protein [Planctomycetota bacterium]
MRIPSCLVLLLTLTMQAAGLAQNFRQNPTNGQLQFFEAKIRPALVKYCYECHSVDAGDSRGGLLVDARSALLEGGDSGPAIVPGNLEDSVLWEAITWSGSEMPPSEKMPASVIADFREWILMGAPDPRVREKMVHVSKISREDIEDGKEHWSFQPPQVLPAASIDSLVAAKLKEEGLQSAAPADALTLLRRLNFTLIGLPPTPPELQSFERAYKSNPDAAIASKVDELLDRPQYGERWGRHWMDVVRYAESSGSRNISYPHAWRYRDYVIDAFNKDTPYNWFVAQQLAGDLLPVKTDGQWQENLVATGYLAIGLKHQDEKNPRKFISDMIDEQIDTTMQAVQGLTVACARCHDHKFDPIPTSDYYALAGIFQSTQTFYGTTRVAQNHRPSDLLLLPIQDSSLTTGGGRTSIADLKQRIEELDRQMVAARGRPADGGPNKDYKSLRNVRNRLAGELATFDAKGNKKVFAMGVQEANQMVNASILISGEIERPAQEVTRGFLQVLGDLNFEIDSNKSSGRKELVQALISRNNPLTARVMVNRIWMHLIGKPIVGTPNNFGFSGMEPSNQALLDYLAIQFMRKNWSIKAMIREIAMSDTFRQSAAYNEQNYLLDPDNAYCWRANARTLEAEALRDAMLAISGQLDLNRPFASAIATGGGRPGSSDTDPDVTYRSVYLPIVRDQIVESLELFDFPDTNMTCSGRTDSIVPTQALYMMNGEFAQAQGQAMAASLEKNFRSVEEQIRQAFLWAYGRPANSAEFAAAQNFFRDFAPASNGSVNASAGNDSSPTAGRGRNRGNAQAGRGGGRAARGGRRGQADSKPATQITARNSTLAVFCQTLMSSARFRILN